METIPAADITGGPNLESTQSGIHWASILGGAATAAAISLVLIPLGSALGFSSFSLFKTDSNTPIVLTAGLAVWLVVMQWISSGVGGYIAGRLRVKWAALHTDEVFFRDTAHGFIAWSVATLLTAAILVFAAGATANAGLQSGAKMMANAGSHSDLNYYTDSLYRAETPQPTPVSAEMTAETTGILTKSLESDALSASDRTYLGRQVAQRTGLSQADAEARVTTTFDQLEGAKQTALRAAEAARKVTVQASILLFLSLVVGAFIASVSAALGGRLRDTY